MTINSPVSVAILLVIALFAFIIYIRKGSAGIVMRTAKNQVEEVCVAQSHRSSRRRTAFAIVVVAQVLALFAGVIDAFPLLIVASSVAVFALIISVAN